MHKGRLIGGGFSLIRQAHRVKLVRIPRAPAWRRAARLKYDRPWRERREFRREALRGSLVILLVWVALIVVVALAGPRS